MKIIIIKYVINKLLKPSPSLLYPSIKPLIALIGYLPPFHNHLSLTSAHSYPSP